MTYRPLVPRWTWLFLAGPVTWYAYFWVVYLAAEAGCEADVGAFVVWVTVVLTGITSVTITFYGWRSFREAASPKVTANDGSIRSLVRAGFLLGGFFVAASLFVGVPALLVGPC
jgi:hypothetical protein